jgi:hypothetical protein
LNGHYSVFDPTGNKIADCGTLRDAVTLVGMRGEGHYYQFKPYPGDIIDVSPNNQLPPNQKYIGWKDVTEKEFDVEFIEVGGQKIPTQQQLPQNYQEPFIPDFHD